MSTYHWYDDVSASLRVAGISTGTTTKSDSCVWVESYGAKGDGTTDDTAAIKAAIADAVSRAVANGSHYAEVNFKPVTYLINGSLTQGGTTLGNALLPLPVPSSSAAKVTLALLGAGEATALPYWSQSVTQKTGTVLRTTVSGTNDATFGEASLLGGPTPAQGYGAYTTTFSNMLVQISGLTIVVPDNPAICGVDLRGVAECNVANLAVFADNHPGSYTLPTTDWQFGLGMPQNNNNDNCTLGSYSAEGMYFGILTSEHTVANSIRVAYCVAGVEHACGDTTGAHTSLSGHGALLNYVSAEACQVGLGSIGSAFPAKIRVLMFDFEPGSGSFGEFARINDSTNQLLGEVTMTDNSGPGTIRGGVTLRVIYLNQSRGVQSTTVSGNGVAYQNPYWRDCAVTITGGTVSNIKIGGVATGLTSGTVIVPSGYTIELDYTVAPSWLWVAL